MRSGRTHISAYLLHCLKSVWKNLLRSGRTHISNGVCRQDILPNCDEILKPSVPWECFGDPFFLIDELEFRCERNFFAMMILPESHTGSREALGRFPDPKGGGRQRGRRRGEGRRESQAKDGSQPRVPTFSKYQIYPFHPLDDVTCRKFPPRSR